MLAGRITWSIQYLKCIMSSCCGHVVRTMASRRIVLPGCVVLLAVQTLMQMPMSLTSHARPTQTSRPEHSGLDVGSPVLTNSRQAEPRDARSQMRNITIPRKYIYRTPPRCNDGTRRERFVAVAAACARYTTLKCVGTYQKRKLLTCSRGHAVDFETTNG